MQFAYQFPEWAERLVLVASGGLGKEVSPLLKAVTLPGAEYVLPLLLHRGSARQLSGQAPWLDGWAGNPATPWLRCGAATPL